MNTTFLGKPNAGIINYLKREETTLTLNFTWDNSSEPCPTLNINDVPQQFTKLIHVQTGIDYGSGNPIPVEKGQTYKIDIWSSSSMRITKFGDETFPMEEASSGIIRNITINDSMTIEIKAETHWS